MTNGTENIIERCNELLVNSYFIYPIMLALCLFFILFTKLKSYGYLTVLIYVILGLFIFMISFREFRQFPESIARTKPVLSRVYLIIFFASFGSSIAYLQFFELPYNKSLWYYFFIGICSSVIFISIEDHSIKRLLPYLTLVLGLNIFLSNFIVFQNGVYASGDTHYQIYKIMLPIIENGNIPSGYTYSFFPIHQIFIASLAIITDIKPVFLYMSAVSLLYAVSALFIYSTINRVADQRFGIIAMLLFIISPNIFYHATHAYQFSYALPLAIILIYIMTVLTMPDMHKKNQVLIQTQLNWKILQILFIGVIVWTHQFTSTMTYIFILIYMIIYLIIFKNRVEWGHNYYLILFLYIVIMFTHWIYVSSVFSSLINIVDVYYSSLFTIENYQVAYSNPNTAITSFPRPFWRIFIDTTGNGIMMMLATMGFLYGIWKKNIHVFLWFTLGLFIYTLVSIGSYISMPLLLGGRLLTFFEAMSLVYLATFGIKLLIDIFGTKGIIFCSILLFIIPIFSLGSTTSGVETSLFIGDQPKLKFYDTSSDLQYRVWIKNNVPENSVIRMSNSWVPQITDDARVYDMLLINDHDQVEYNVSLFGEYISLNKHDSMGIRVIGISEQEQVELVKLKKLSTNEAQARHERITKLDIAEIERVILQLTNIYSNGETSVCIILSNGKN